MSLDRIDNNGDYCPGNCRWASRATQARNKSKSRIIEIGGVSRTVPEWAEVSGNSRKRITDRLKLGWSERDAVFAKFGERFAGADAMIAAEKESK